MSATFYTATGSVYQVRTEPRLEVRRLPSLDHPDSSPLRGDGAWVPLSHMPTIRNGERVVMEIRLRGDGIPTIRTTTPVIDIKEDA